MLHPDKDPASQRAILMAMYNENTTHVRHHESQIASIATLSVAAISALIGLATFDKQINIWDVPFTLLITICGLFSALFVAKSFERAMFHTERFRAFRDELDRVYMGGRLEAIKEIADMRHKHNTTSRILIVGKYVRLHKLWVWLFNLMTIVGIIMTVMALRTDLPQASTNDVQPSKQINDTAKPHQEIQPSTDPS